MTTAGQWVFSFSTGIYRVEKVVQKYYEESDVPHITSEDNIGSLNPNRQIISKRLLNSKMQKSIGYEVCSEAYVKPLNNTELVSIQTELLKRPSLIQELNEYLIPPIESIYNMRLRLNDDQEKSLAEALVAFIQKGKTFLEIINEMKRIGADKLKPATWATHNLQFVNTDFETKDKRQIWRCPRLYESG
jgi:hypothetical protein